MTGNFSRNDRTQRKFHSISGEGRGGVTNNRVDSQHTMLQLHDPACTQYYVGIFFLCSFFSSFPLHVRSISLPVNKTEPHHHCSHVEKLARNVVVRSHSTMVPTWLPV